MHKYKNFIYVFGGFGEGKHYNDLYALNIDSL